MYEAEGYEAEGEDGTVGEVVSEANILGAIARRRVAPQVRPVRAPGQRVYEKPPLPSVPAHPHTARLKSYLGLGFATWGPADATDKPLQVTPQESFRGSRLIIDLSIVAGPSAGMVLMKRIDIGTMPQSPSVDQPAPAAMFQATATYSAIDLQIAYRAMIIQVTLGITAAPGGGCSVTASAGFFGEWIR